MSNPFGPGDAGQHVWNYFQMHAAQRMSVFNFFLVISALVAAGLAAALQGSVRFAAFGIPLGLLLVLIAFVFWKLDQRTSHLIKHAEQALKELEHTFPGAAFHLFLTEPTKTMDAVRTGNWWTRPWTYGKSFRLVFGVMAVAGSVGSAIAAARSFGVLTW